MSPFCENFVGFLSENNVKVHHTLASLADKLSLIMLLGKEDDLSTALETWARVNTSVSRIVQASVAEKAAADFDAETWLRDALFLGMNRKLCSIRPEEATQPVCLQMAEDITKCAALVNTGISAELEFGDLSADLQQLAVIFSVSGGQALWSASELRATASMLRTSRKMLRLQPFLTPALGKQLLAAVSEAIQKRAGDDIAVSKVQRAVDVLKDEEMLDVAINTVAGSMEVINADRAFDESAIHCMQESIGLVSEALKLFSSQVHMKSTASMFATWATRASMLVDTFSASARTRLFATVRGVVSELAECSGDGMTRWKPRPFLDLGRALQARPFQRPSSTLP